MSVRSYKKAVEGTAKIILAQCETCLLGVVKNLDCARFAEQKFEPLDLAVKAGSSRRWDTSPFLQYIIELYHKH